jgi:SAM-dependent methyltransferase
MTGTCSQPASTAPSRPPLAPAKDSSQETYHQSVLNLSWQWLASLAYVCLGRRPFSKGYRHYKARYLKTVLEDQSLFEVFNTGRPLPTNFGLRLDERVVEYPWLLSKLSRQSPGARFLDAGSTLNHEFILAHPFVRRHNWTILTLAPESHCFWNRGVSYHYEDLRALPFKDDWFDGIACLSVIEHVGMDNVDYTGSESYREQRPQDYRLAIQEMRRVLKPHGTLFLTVPFGRYENHGWLQQFDRELLSDLIAQFQPRQVTETFFRYTQQGWKFATQHECNGLRYCDFARRPGIDSAFAVAATAVACVQLQK